MVQMSLYRYCRAADGVLDPKGPLATRADRRLQLHHPIIVGAAPRVGRRTVQSRKLKPRKLILSAYVDFSRKLEPPKITRHTVYYYRYRAINVIINKCRYLKHEKRYLSYLSGALDSGNVWPACPKV